MANWAEAAWIVKTLQRRLELNKHVEEYQDEVVKLDTKVDKLYDKKISFIAKDNGSGNPSGYSDFFPNMIWFIEEEESNNG